MNIGPTVLNKYKDEIPKNAVFIGRPSMWGNPFVIGIDGDRDTVICKYEEWLHSNPAMIHAVKRMLAGKDLVCFCSPNPCHGDVLLSIANSPM